MRPELLARALQEFLADARSGVVIEDGQIVFDLETAQYSVSEEHGKCLLHLWSDERNLVRSVVDAETKNGVLALSVRRFAQAKPHKLEICRDRDRRTPSAKKSARGRYAQVLQRVLHRTEPDRSLAGGKLATSMDLERSFSPVYARGLLRRGRTALAVLGVSQQETQSSVDAALTFGLLWLAACREGEAGSSVVEGLRLYVPPRRSTTLQIRLAHLNHDAAKFQLFELDERDESLTEIDVQDTGNIYTRLVHCFDAGQTRARFAAAIQRVLAVVPQADVAVLSPTELAFRIHGLEFAWTRAINKPGTFSVDEETVFGVPGFEAHLTDDSVDTFAAFAKTIADARSVDGDRRDPLWRLYPERWLESLVFKNVAAIDSRFETNSRNHPRPDAVRAVVPDAMSPVSTRVYSQVPAFSAADRAMIDVLTCTHDGRLAVLELKADEDIHLPLQGLDYWARVLWHHQRGEFRQYGYFPGVELSPKPPLLYLVAPSLRVHPSADTILRFFSPDIEWTLVGLDERWRESVKVVFRKTSARK
jgi:hypothetical protein